MLQVHVLIETREIVNVLDVYAEIHKKKTLVCYQRQNNL